jgi:hypothetical protein
MKSNQFKKNRLLLVGLLLVVFLVLIMSYFLQQRSQEVIKIVRVTIDHGACDELHTKIHKQGNLQIAEVTAVSTSNQCTQQLLQSPIDIKFSKKKFEKASYQVIYSGQELQKGEF